MKEYCAEPHRVATPAGKSPRPLMDLRRAVQAGMCVLDCAHESAVSHLPLPASLSLFNLDFRRKELLVNSFGFRIWAFSCERGKIYEDAVSGVLCSVNIC